MTILTVQAYWVPHTKHMDSLYAINGFAGHSLNCMNLFHSNKFKNKLIRFSRNISFFLCVKYAQTI